MGYPIPLVNGFPDILWRNCLDWKCCVNRQWLCRTQKSARTCRAAAYEVAIKSTLSGPGKAMAEDLRRFPVSLST
jgi:hypothetical protein